MASKASVAQTTVGSNPAATAVVARCDARRLRSEALGGPPQELGSMTELVGFRAARPTPTGVISYDPTTHGQVNIVAGRGV